MKLGQALRQLRKQKGLTLAELADKTGSYVGNLSRIERDLSNPSLDLLYRISEALDHSMADLFLATGEGYAAQDARQVALNTVFGSLLSQDQDLLLETARMLQRRSHQESLSEG